MTKTFDFKAFDQHPAMSEAIDNLSIAMIQHERELMDLCTDVPKIADPLPMLLTFAAASALRRAMREQNYHSLGHEGMGIAAQKMAVLANGIPEMCQLGMVEQFLETIPTPATEEGKATIDELDDDERIKVAMAVLQIIRLTSSKGGRK